MSSINLSDCPSTCFQPSVRNAYFSDHVPEDDPFQLFSLWRLLAFVYLRKAPAQFLVGLKLFHGSFQLYND